MPVLSAYVLPHPPVVIPAVGKGRENEISKTIASFERVAKEISVHRPDTIVVASPHSTIYADYFHISGGERARGDLAQFGARGTAIEKLYDKEFVETLSKLADRAHLPAGTLGGREKELDHGTLIPLFFVEKQFQSYSLVRVGVSGLSALDHYRLGACVAEAAKQLQKRIVFIASGDLSHRLREDGPYGYAPEGPEFDTKLTQALSMGDFLSLFSLDGELAEAAGECGLRSIYMLAGVLDGQAVQSELLSYEGPFGVGYGICAFTPTGLDEDRKFERQVLELRQNERDQVRRTEGEYVRLARHTLEAYVRTGSKPPLPDGLSDGLAIERAGAFVSLKKDGRLRGCIGTISPTCASLAEEIAQNAVSAGTNDPRFLPVLPEELDSLVYSVDVLGKAEPIESKAQLDPKRYGVIVSRGARRGLLLPDLEGVNTVDEQLSIALQKAGISPNESYTIERFEVVRHK